MLKAPPYSVAFLLPAVVVLGLICGGPFVFAAPLMIFVLIPIADALLGKDESNDAQASLLFDVWLWLWVPTQLGLVVWTCFAVGVEGRSAIEAFGLIVSCGITGGAGGITVAHELMHRKDAASRACAELLMLSVSYPHFCIEHVLGHHRNVSTPRDAISAWRLETGRVKKLNVAGTLRDRRVRYPLMTVAMYLSTLVAGVEVLATLIAVGGVAFLLLEVINYIEHYGLQRAEIAPGKYEHVQPKHSWTSPHRLTNWYLFNLPRHADHHYLAARPYPQLRHFSEAPQMPAGYGTMFLIALVPPLWHRIMDHRALAQNGGDRPQVTPNTKIRTDIEGLPAS